MWFVFWHSSEFAAGRCHFKIQGSILNLVLFSFASREWPPHPFETFWQCVSRIKNDIDDLIVTCASPLLIDLCCVTNVNLVRKLKMLKQVFRCLQLVTILLSRRVVRCWHESWGSRNDLFLNLHCCLPSLARDWRWIFQSLWQLFLWL